jgi:hypothetical protein
MEGWRQRRLRSIEDHSTTQGNYKIGLTPTGLLMEGLGLRKLAAFLLMTLYCHTCQFSHDGVTTRLRFPGGVAEQAMIDVQKNVRKRVTVGTGAFALERIAMATIAVLVFQLSDWGDTDSSGSVPFRIFVANQHATPLAYTVQNSSRRSL